MAALPQYGVTNESMSASLRRLRKDRESSLCYRLKSIYYDSKFIKRCIHALGATGIPVFANLRNGLWYRESFDGSAYFKSTDGHSHHWNFSFKRLNLNFAIVAAKSNGGILIDSTRRGKQYPDALSMTVPIWCCVMNRSLCRLNRRLGASWNTDLCVPDWVSKEEYSFVERNIDTWVERMVSDHKHLLQSMIGVLSKPLRPLWFSPSSSPFDPIDFSKLTFTPIICVSASEVVSSERFREVHSWPYIQGAGDDEEHWALAGLTPNLFWKHHTELLKINDSDLFEKQALRLIASAGEKKSDCNTCTGDGGIRLCPIIWMGNNVEDPRASIGLLCVKKDVLGCSISGDTDAETLYIFDVSEKGHRFHCSKKAVVYHCPIPCDRKKGPADKLRWIGTILPAISKFCIEALVKREYKLKRKLLIVQEDRETFALALVTAALCIVFQDSALTTLETAARLTSVGYAKNIDKQVVRQVYAYVQMFMTEGSPPRRYMQYMNEFFYQRQDWMFELGMKNGRVDE